MQFSQSASPTRTALFIAAGLISSRVAVFADTLTAANPWLGPLPLQNERPYQAMFLHPPAVEPEVLPAGSQSWSAQLDVANNLLLPAPGPGGQMVDEDFETQRLKLNWSRGLGKRRDWGASANFTARNGGVLDTFLSNYHHLVGLGADGKDHPIGRDSLPRNRSRLFFDDGNGHGIDQGSATGIGDTTIWVKQQLTEGRFATAVRLAAKVPTGDDAKVLGSGGLDAGVFLDGRYICNPRFAFFGGAGASAFGHSSIPNSKKSGLQGNFGLEWRLGARTSFLAQLDASTRTVTTGNSFADRTPVIGSIGVKHRASAGRLMWLSLSENGDYTKYHVPPTGNIAPDITLTFGYQWTH